MDQAAVDDRLRFTAPMGYATIPCQDDDPRGL
jgi:hypothetical protein